MSLGLHRPVLDHFTIDLMQLISLSGVTKHDMNSGQKVRYYAAILSCENDSGLWSASTVEQFVNSFFASEKLLNILPRMHMVSTGPEANKLTCMCH